MQKNKLKRIIMIFWLMLLSPVLIIFITLLLNRAHLLDEPGLSKRLKIFLSSNVAEIKTDAMLPELARPVFKQGADALFQTTIDSVNRLGWQITEIDNNKRIIHAVVTTALFNFKDDIRITVIETTAGSSLQAVSRSRVGRGDLAANSHHLQQLLSELRAGDQSSHGLK